MILLVSYDLRTPNKNYDDLYATLKTADDRLTQKGHDVGLATDERLEMLKR